MTREMTREKAYEKVAKIMMNIAKTGNYAEFTKADRLAYEYGIFVEETEEGIAVEDDYFRFQFQ